MLCKFRSYGQLMHTLSHTHSHVQRYMTRNNHLPTHASCVIGYGLISPQLDLLGAVLSALSLWKHLFAGRQNSWLCISVNCSMITWVAHTHAIYYILQCDAVCSVVSIQLVSNQKYLTKKASRTIVSRTKPAKALYLELLTYEVYIYMTPSAL